ncbi:MAG: diguanylate cyclase [bacterium]
MEKEIINLLKLVSNTTDAHTSVIFVANSHDKILKLKGIYSLSNNINENITIPFGEGLIGWVANHKEAINASEFKRDATTLQFYTENEDVKSFLAVPILKQDELKGVLCIDSKQRYVFTNKDQKILIGFADQFANLLSDQEVRSKVLGLDDIYNLFKPLLTLTRLEDIFNNTIEISQKVLNFDTCSLSLLNSTGNALEIKVARGYHREFIGKIQQSFSHGLAGWVVRNKSFLLIPDLKRDPTKTFIFDQDEPKLNMKSFLGVPLMMEDNVIGVLNYTSDSAYGFDQTQANIIHLLANQISPLILNLKLKQKIQHMVYTDNLTGVGNHSFFHERLSVELRDTPKDKSVSLLLIDVDDFSKINNLHTYKVGDSILKKLTTIFIKLVREIDIVARYGEDRFAILLIDTSIKDAEKVAEKIRVTVEHTIFVIHGQEVHLSISLGISTFHQDSHSKEELIEHAQRSLWYCKNNGKNMMFLYNNFGSTPNE